MRKPEAENIHFTKIMRLYEKYGFVTMPLKYGEKTPAMSGAYKHLTESYPTNPATDNIAVLLAPSRLVCLDIDDIEKFKAIVSSQIYNTFRSKALIRISPNTRREAFFYKIPQGYVSDDFRTVSLGKVGAYYCCQGDPARPSSRYMGIPPSFLDEYGGYYSWIIVDDESGEDIKIDKFDKNMTDIALGGLHNMPQKLAKQWKAESIRKLQVEFTTQDGYMQVVSEWLRVKRGWDFRDKAVELGYGITPMGHLLHPDSTSGSAGLKYYSKDQLWYNHSNSDATLPNTSTVSLFDILVALEFDGDYETAQKEICNGTYNQNLADRIDAENEGVGTSEADKEIEGESVENIESFDSITIESGVLPDEIIFPNNLRGRLARYYYSRSVVYNKIAAHVAARITLAFLGGKMASMDFQGRSSRTNIFCQLIGLPGSGKEIIQNGIEKFLLEIGNNGNASVDPTLSNIVGNITNENGSAQGLMEMFMELQQRPDMLHIEDESGGSSSQVGKGNKTIEDLFTFRLKQFSADSISQRRLKKHGNKQQEEPPKPIYGQTFTWVGATTPSNIKRSSSFLVSSGGASRILYYSMEPYTEEPITDVDVMIKKAKKLAFSDEELNQLIRDVEDYADQQYFPNTFERNENKGPTYYSRVKNSIEIPLTKKAYELILKIDAWRRSLPEFEQNVWARYAEYCIKLALVEARCANGVEFKTKTGGVGSSPMRAVANSGVGSQPVALNNISHNMLITEKMIRSASMEVKMCLEYSQDLFEVMAQEEMDNLSVQQRYREVEHILMTKMLNLNANQENKVLTKFADKSKGVLNYGITASALTMIDAYKTATKIEKQQIRDFLDTSQHLAIQELKKSTKMKKGKTNRGRPAHAYFLRERGPKLTHVIRRNPSSKTVFEVVCVSRDGITTSDKKKDVKKLPNTVKKGFSAKDYL